MKKAATPTRRRSRSRSRQQTNQPLSGIAQNTGMGGDPVVQGETARASTEAPTRRNTRTATRSRSARRRASPAGVGAQTRQQGVSYGVAFAGLAKQCASLMGSGISKQEISKFIGAL
jgi:hypothetical protein